MLHSILFEALGAFLGRDGEVLDIWELSEEGDGGQKIVLELKGGLVPLGIEDEDQEVSKVVEMGAGKHLIGLKLDHFRHVDYDELIL